MSFWVGSTQSNDLELSHETIVSFLAGGCGMISFRPWFGAGTSAPGSCSGVRRIEQEKNAFGIKLHLRIMLDALMI